MWNLSISKPIILYPLVLCGIVWEVGQSLHWGNFCSFEAQFKLKNDVHRIGWRTVVDIVFSPFCQQLSTLVVCSYQERFDIGAVNTYSSEIVSGRSCCKYAGMEMITWKLMKDQKELWTSYCMEEVKSIWICTKVNNELFNRITEIELRNSSEFIQ